MIQVVKLPNSIGKPNDLVLEIEGMRYEMSKIDCGVAPTHSDLFERLVESQQDGVHNLRYLNDRFTSLSVLVPGNRSLVMSLLVYLHHPVEVEQIVALIRVY
mgnify:FL=1